MIKHHQHQGGEWIDVFLQPGEFYFGGRETRIRTLLGSCVAITMWHPRLKIGGMCHYLLVDGRCKPKAGGLDGRYAHDALELFMRELAKHASRPKDYEVKMFGGGDQFPGHTRSGQVSLSDHNVLVGRGLLRQHGFAIKAEHSGGTGHRNVIFDVGSGQVWIKHVARTPECA